MLARVGPGAAPPSAPALGPFVNGSFGHFSKQGKHRPVKYSGQERGPFASPGTGHSPLATPSWYNR